MTQEKNQNLLQKFLHLGITEDATFIDVQKSYMFNLFILIGAPFAIISLIVNLFQEAHFPALVNIIQLLCFSIALWIVIKKQFLPLRVWILLCLSAMSVVAAYSYQNSGEYRLLIMIVAAVVLFDYTWQYLLYALSVSLLFVYIRIDNLPNVDTIAVGELIFTSLKIFLPLLLFVLTLLYFKTIYFKNLLQLENANKALVIAKDQKERILNTVAHDLRSPISNISGITKLMQLDEISTEEKEKFLRLIEHSSHTALDLINELLQHSDAQVRFNLLKHTAINQLIMSWVPGLQFRANEKQITIATQLHLEEMHANIDADRMQRVITNLVNNSIKFSPEGSAIVIETYRENAWAVILVKDQGIGIPAEKHAYIFEMFTNAQRLGTAGEKSFGMGLSICKQIVEQHQGFISIESEEGKGSTFVIKIPIVKNRSRTQAQATSSPVDAANNLNQSSLSS